MGSNLTMLAPKIRAFSKHHKCVTIYLYKWIVIENKRVLWWWKATIRNWMSTIKLHFCLVGQFWYIYISDAKYWNEYGKDQIQRALKAEKLNRNIAKNVVLFIGDGMGITTNTASRILKGQLAGGTGEEASMVWDEFPHVALSKVSWYSTTKVDTNKMNCFASGHRSWEFYFGQLFKNK